MSEHYHRITSRSLRAAWAAPLAAALLTLSPQLADLSQAKEDISGVWYDDTGKGAVELYPCGTGFCGRIVWLRSPTSSTGRPLRDAHNPEPRQRARPICGLQIVEDVRAQSDGTWDGGKIYDPKVGKSYDIAIERLNSDSLRITGYLGVRLFGKSFVWRRAPADLALCVAASG